MGTPVKEKVVESLVSQPSSSPVTRVCLKPQVSKRVTTSANNVTDVVTRFETWGFKHTLVTGLELGWETSDSTTFSFTGVPTASLLHPTALPDIS